RRLRYCRYADDWILGLYVIYNLERSGRLLNNLHYVYSELVSNVLFQRSRARLYIIIGPKTEAEEIKRRIKTFLQEELKLEFQAEYRGLVEYYQLADNLHRLIHLKWVMEVSLTKTLARKFQITVPQVYKRYQATLRTGKQPYKGLQIVVPREGKNPLVATWGG